MTWFALSLVLLGQAPAVATAPASAPARPLDIYFVDVMGGAATLVVTPEGESVLIDTGWPGEGDRDPKRIEAVVRDEAKLDRVDHLVTTHWHVDHFGGVAGLAKRLPIGRFWDRGLPDPNEPNGDKARFPEGPGPDDPMGMAYRAASAGKRAALKAGDRLPLKGATEAVVLAASGTVVDDPAAPANPRAGEAPPDQRPDPSDNARSVVLRFKLGRFTFLDCGDLTWNVEKQLVAPRDLIGPVDLYQVTHHGMDISNNPLLLATIAPTVAVMDNAPRKGGAPATVRRLRALPSLQAAYQLHRNASPAPDANTDPALIANPPGTQGQFIHASFPPGSPTFTVQIGPDGPKREFPLH